MTERILPTSQEIMSAAADDEGSLQEKLLNAFTYGTMQDNASSSSSSSSESPNLATKKATSVLVKVWKESPKIENTLVDTIWFSSSSLVSTESQRNALNQIVSELLQIPDRPSFWRGLQGALDPNTLESLALVPDKATLMKKLKKINTETHYRQTKYNLLHEESEGYAKVLTLLIGDIQHLSVQEMHRYIGAFELDPNRVLDLLLDLLEATLEKAGPSLKQPVKKEALEKVDVDLVKEQARQELLLTLINSFSISKIPYLLSFKLNFFQKESKAVPASFYSMVMFLAERGLLELSVLVSTAQSDISACFVVYEKFMKKRIASMNRIRLNDGDGNKQDPKLLELQSELEECIQKLESQNALVGMLKLHLDSGSFELALRLLKNGDSWDRLCTLLPAKIGGPLYEYLLDQVSKVYNEYISTPVLASEVKKQQKNEETSSDEVKDAEMNGETTKETSLNQFLEAYSLPLKALANSGVLSTETVLYCKLCRLTRAFLEKDGEVKKVDDPVYEFLRVVLVPTLSLFPPNPALSAELWGVLSLLSYAIRYRLYQDWRGAGLERWGMGSKPFIQVQSETEAGKAARYSLKRLSKDNVRDMGRQVAKVTHSNPLVVFTSILNQVESYDNLIQMMVETVRYVTPLSLDVLGYCVLGRLCGSVGGVNRSRLKDDGVNVSQWLQSLESFIGAFYKKCPNVEFRGLLSYLIQRLKEGHVLELGVLRTLLTTAGGYGFADYSPISSLSASQIAGRAGSRKLKEETFAFGVVERFNEQASVLVRSVLQSEGVGVMMLILLAQIRNRIVFTQQAKHVKLVGNLSDSCQVVMSVLLQFLTDESDEKPDDKNGNKNSSSIYGASLPSLQSLHQDFGLDPCVAWMLRRPLYHLKTESNGENGETYKAVIQNMFPREVLATVSESLFEAFFAHSSYDLFLPEESYQTEIARLKKEEERLVHRHKNHQPGVEFGIQFTRADEIELERVRQVATKLQSDLEKQKKHSEAAQNALKSKAKDFFPSQEVSLGAVRTLLTHCIYPRCVLTPDDAVYCAHFVLMLHDMGTPGFSILHYFEELVSSIRGTLFCSTESEAAAIGILLHESWKVICRWRYDEKAFETELVGKPGCLMLESEEAKAQPVGKAKYKELYNRWHTAIGSFVLGCLKSTEYMHLRSCFVVMSRIVEVFPTRPKLGERILEAIVPIQKDDYPLEDIKTAAHAYGALLTKARSQGSWKEEDAADAKAREDKKKAAIAERKRKAKEQFDAMKLDTDQITEEIGESRTRGWNGGIDNRNSRHDDNRRGPQAPARLGLPREGDRDRDRRQDDRGRNGERVGGKDDREGRGFERSKSERRREDQQEDRRRDQSKDGRWERGVPPPPTGRGAKRDLSPSQDERPPKRSRNETPRFEAPDHSDSRREGGRGNLPRERAAPGTTAVRGDRGDRSGGYRRSGPRR